MLLLLLLPACLRTKPGISKSQPGFFEVNVLCNSSCTRAGCIHCVYCSLQFIGIPLFHNFTSV